MNTHDHDEPQSILFLKMQQNTLKDEALAKAIIIGAVVILLLIFSAIKFIFT